MPLNFEQPKRKNPIISKFKNAAFTILNLIRPDIILGVFLLFAILFPFIKIEAEGFYIVFGIFIVMFFAERISVRINRRYEKQS